MFGVRLELLNPENKIPAGVKDGEYNLDGGLLELGVFVDGNSSTVVGDTDRVVRVNHNFCMGAVARECLVDCVVHDLIHQVVKASGTGGSDVHARAFADRFKTLQYLDVFSRV